jgi:hypothetical protein
MGCGLERFGKNGQAQAGSRTAISLASSDGDGAVATPVFSRARAVTASPNRQCLPCTGCCQGWLRAEIRGHTVCAGSPCPFSQPDGCSIYSTRPKDPCRDFVCSWRVTASPLPDWMRPDLCGAIVLLSHSWHGQLVIQATPVGRSIPERTLEWLKQHALQTGRPLVFGERIVENERYSGVRLRGYGPPEFRRLVEKVAGSDPEASLAMSAE